MQALIAFLTFIFSPSDDWLLKRIYELQIDPAELPVSVEKYNHIVKVYPSFPADASSLAVWADILDREGHTFEAHEWRKKIINEKDLSADVRADLQLRLGETELQNGNFSSAKNLFSAVFNSQGPRSSDAEINLLVTALATGQTADAQKLAADIKTHWENEPLPSRAIFPLGLAAFAINDFTEASRVLAKSSDDPRAQYFLGLCERKQNHLQIALGNWQKILQHSPHTLWSELARYQIAETYFLTGDDSLSRATCEKALEENPEGSQRDMFVFRLAAISMRQGNYEEALSHLANASWNGDLGSRAMIMTGESMVKAGKSGEMFDKLANRLPYSQSAESLYQTAWANLFDKDYKRSLHLAEVALEDFYDPTITPKLLLLQGLAYEHQNQEAEAFATYQTVADRFPQSLAAAQSAHWMLRGYMRVGRTREAVTHGGNLWNSLGGDLQREIPETAFWLGEAHKQLNRWEDANNYFSKFLALAKVNHPMVPYAQFEQAAVLAKKGEVDGALATLDQFLKNAAEEKNSPWVNLATLQKGNIYFNEKQYEKAVVAYRVTTDIPKALYYEAAALYRMDYFSESIEKWGTLAEKFPDNSYTEKGMFRRGRTLFEMARTTEAVGAFAAFMEKYPSSPKVKEALIQSAHAYYNAGDVAAAAPFYAQYLTRYRTSEDLAMVTPYLASCYVQMGKNLTDVEKLLAGLPPADPLAGLRWESGARDFNEKKFPEAYATFARLLSDFPTNTNSPNALFYRAESLFSDGQWQDAEGAYNNYLQISSEEKLEQAPLALFHKGASIFQQNRLLAAAAVFQSILDHYPTHKLSPEARSNMLLCYYYLGDWNTLDQMKLKYDEKLYAALPSLEQVAPAPSTVSGSPTTTSSMRETREGPYLLNKEKESELNAQRVTSGKNQGTEFIATKDTAHQ